MSSAEQLFWGVIVLALSITLVKDLIELSKPTQSDKESRKQ